MGRAWGSLADMNPFGSFMILSGFFFLGACIFVCPEVG